MHIDDAGAETQPPELHRGFHGSGDHAPGSDEGHVRAPHQDSGLSYGELGSRLIDLRHGGNATEAQVRWPILCCECRYRFSDFDAVGWAHDGEVGHGPKGAHIFKGVVRRAELAHREARPDADKLHVLLHVPEVVAHEFATPHCCEIGEGSCEGNPPIVSHTGCQADHVLLGNTHVEESVRQCMPEPLHAGGDREVRREADDAGIVYGNV